MTDTAHGTVNMIAAFVNHWPLGVILGKANAYLSLETQRQCSDLAAERTASAFLSLFTLIVLLIHV